MDFQDIEKYLPQYLSAESKDKLLAEIKSFPNNIDNRMYSHIDSENIFQGDGLIGFQFIAFPKTEIKEEVNVIVLSNTCDIDPVNKRFFPSQICYAPIIELEKYQNILISGGVSEQRCEGHITDIKKQRITQILFLPAGANLSKDSIVFLDRINHCSNKSVEPKEVSGKRIFTLSDYGLYLFLTKLSLHFNRIQEKVDRNKGIIL